eukprot:5688720-Pleurochrysis_carterae.AAC.1
MKREGIWKAMIRSAMALSSCVNSRRPLLANTVRKSVRIVSLDLYSSRASIEESPVTFLMMPESTKRCPGKSSVATMR